MIALEKAKSIKSVPYTGTVYNLELQSNSAGTEKEDQYFIDSLTGIITHNCFPKDLNALISFSGDTDTPILDAVLLRNTTIDRSEPNSEVEARIFELCDAIEKNQKELTDLISELERNLLPTG